MGYAETWLQKAGLGWIVWGGALGVVSLVEVKEWMPLGNLVPTVDMEHHFQSLSSDGLLASFRVPPSPSSCCPLECPCNSKSSWRSDSSKHWNWGVFHIMGGQPSWVPAQLLRRTFQIYKCFIAELLTKKSPCVLPSPVPGHEQGKTLPSLLL